MVNTFTVVENNSREGWQLLLEELSQSNAVPGQPAHAMAFDKAMMPQELQNKIILALRR